MLPMCPCLVLVESISLARERLKLRLTLLFSMDLLSHPSMVPTHMESTHMSLASLLPVSMLLTFLSPVLARRRGKLKLMPRFSLLDTPMLESMPQTQSLAMLLPTLASEPFTPLLLECAPMSAVNKSLADRHCKFTLILTLKHL